MNTLSNIDYVNECLPAINAFGFEEICLEEREHFLKWYDTENERLKNSGEHYKLRKEMKKCCYDNCYILATAFSCFNESMIGELIGSNVKGIAPHQYMILADFITLPQLVIHWYIGTSMPIKTLAVVPHGYDSGKMVH